MSDQFARQAMSYENEFRQCVGGLLGIATGFLADRELNDAEIHFLRDWLDAHDEIRHSWPGDVIHARIRSVLADGVITEAERLHLVQTLQQLIGGDPHELAAAGHVTELAFDDVARVEFTGSVFVVTGNFVFGPRESCESAIERHGGVLSKGVTRKVRYVIVGSLGSPEWKHGSFGTKIEKAVNYKAKGVPLLVIREDCWARSLAGLTV